MSQEIMKVASELQSKLSRQEIEIDTPCGNDPYIDIIGGIHARAAINFSHPGRFPRIEEEMKLIENLIQIQTS